MTELTFHENLFITIAALSAFFFLLAAGAFVVEVLLPWCRSWRRK